MRPLPAATGLLAAALVTVAAGCGSAPAPSAAGASGHGTQPMSLASSVSTTAHTWAVLPMGARSGSNQFWQLVGLTTGARSWQLDTPPDVATNGALALAGPAGAGLIAGVRPSLYLNFSPLSQTTDAGRQWTAGPPAAGLASVPDALAGTRGGSLLVLGRSGQISTGSLTGSRWQRLTSRALLAASAAGRSCDPAELTAVAYSPAGTPLVAADCERPGRAGIFAVSDSAAVPAGPALPAAYSGARVRVLRLTTAGTSTVALLQAGDGRAAVVLAGWRDAAGRWTLSPPLSLSGATVRSSSSGPAGSIGVLLSSGRGAVAAGPDSSWRILSPVPGSGAAVLALPAGGQPEALTATGGTLTVWRLAAGGTGWGRVQVMKVPIQYGSSG